ncbi:hypothetical protein [Sorangium sp. So ce341]|uniref:hypothetical protein n=1 Tax=Sorangium sp. So ce341 TaxID=3133302 RepID=UPI003F61F921
MEEIKAAVVRHLKSQRNHEDAVALWEQIWARFRRDGSRGVQKLLDELLEQPDAAGKESER